ncbi:hypothetical protein B0A48_10690 [Cryoendolithus antarcticus]|uniref:Phosphoribosyltransferase domain-containing protein n=1 Tax=Cryoendolithus antarcticus TaxID=1507870 RepID=A0A1V8SY14_9PEZI|nr:hypothetical protein B0A48_10690 [Cryoendolithus antarcticus]
MATQTPAKIIGLYGLPGIGKTTLLNLLKELLPHDAFAFCEGSEMVANAAGGSLDTFRNADGNTNNLFRTQAIANIASECTASGKTGIVTGHYSFLNAGAESPGVVFSAAETRHYTHIIYLSASGEEIEQRCRDDARARVPLAAAEINRWAAKEVKELEPICYRNRILLSVLRIEQMSPIKVAEVIASLIQRFHLQSPALNEHCVTTVMNEFLSKQSATLQSVFIFDGDKTLRDEDTTESFWLFDFAGYSDCALRQAAQLYREIGSSSFTKYCAEVTSETHVVPELRNIIASVEQHEHTAVFVVTSGLRRVWEVVLRGLVENIDMIGNNPFDEAGSEYVVTPATKADVVAQLQDQGLEVWAFGDSPLDLPMLKKGDHRVVVVGKAATRSRSIKKELASAIEDGSLPGIARLLSSPQDCNICPSRLSTAMLPSIHSADITKVLHDSPPRFRLYHATDKSLSKLLRTPTRIATYQGPSLRKAHEQIGRYLATEYVSEILIVPLIRGGEPMAMGVSNVFSEVMFLQAKSPADMTLKHLNQCKAVILLASVVNSGASIAEFVTHIRARRVSVPVVVVAGVVQADAVRPGGSIRKMALKNDIAIVALQLSDNKYTGKEVTDTGARLFNTTALESE